MTPNELTHNATGDRENRPTASLDTAATVTFTVDSSGNITPTTLQRANPGDCIVVNNAAGNTFTGAIYAVRDGKNKTQQLVGQSSMTVGTTYTIKSDARNHSYTITSTAPGAAVGRPTTTDNGTLRVGSGGTGVPGDDDGDDDDGHGSGGHQ